MSEWREYLLEDVVEKFIDYRGKTPKKTVTGIPLVTAKVVKAGKILPPNEFIAPEDYDSWMTRGLPEIDDVVLTTEAPLGEVALIKDKNIALAQRIITLRGKENLLFNPFLKFYFQNETGQHELQSRASGTTVFGIKASVLKKVPVELPPLPEQKAIAAVLSSLDDKIDLLHRQNQTLEAMAGTLFRQWFVEEAQEDWEAVKLGDFFTVVTGKKDANFSTDDGEYPFFTCSQTAIKSPSYSFEGAAILLAGNGDFNVKRYIGKFEAYQRTYVLIPYEVEYFGFLYTLMKYYLSEITGGHQGSVINFITKGMITDFNFSLPVDRGMLTERLAQFNEVYEKVDSNTKQIRTLEKLRDNLLPKLMSGEVRVV